MARLAGFLKQDLEQDSAATKTDEPPPLKSCKTHGDFAHWVEANLEINLPFNDIESPSKRRKSPSQTTKQHFSFLYYKSPHRLLAILEECYLEKVRGNDFTLARLRNALKIGVDDLNRQHANKIPKPLDRRRSPLPQSASGHMGADILLAPTSPSLSTKRAHMAVHNDNPYSPLALTTAKDDDEDMDEVNRKGVCRSYSDLFGFAPGSMVAPCAKRHLDGTPVDPLLQQSDRIMQEIPPPNPRVPSAAMSPTTATSYRSALTSIRDDPPPKSATPSLTTSFGINVTTSFSTNANTSFWSEPVDTEPQSTATSLQSSMCLDGADDVIPTQSSAYGEFPSQIGSSQMRAFEDRKLKANEPPSSNYEQGETLSQQEFVSPRPRLKARAQDAEDKTCWNCGSPRRLPDTEATDELIAMPNFDQKGTNVISMPPYKSPAKNEQESPSKTSWRFKQIVEKGLIPANSPGSDVFMLLPYNLQWEVTRLLQSKKVSLERLQQQWHEPRTVESLYAVDPSVARLRVNGFDESSEDFSLSAKLVPASHSDALPLELQLMPPVRQRSNEFERAHVTSRVLVIEFSPCKLHVGQLSIDQVKQAVCDMIGNENKLFGRTWWEFFTREKKRKKSTIKPGTVEFHLFATEGIGLEPISIIQFLDPLLPFRENAHQLSGKLYARFEIKASRTDEGPIFCKDQIEIIDDIYATDVDDDERFNDSQLPFDKSFDNDKRDVMTDGCGSITPEGMRLICDKVGRNGLLPSAVQGRFAGAKGMWMLNRDEDPFSDSSTPKPRKLITIRRSQMKVVQKATEDEFTFHVVKFSAPPKVSPLYAGFLPILHERSGSDAKARILKYVESQVQTLLMSFDENVGDANAFRRWISTQHEIARSADRHLGIDTMAGFPTARAEKIIQMLEAGFEPTKCMYLAEEVSLMLNAMLSLKKRNFRIPCSRATVVIGLPDPTGTLEPGEVHLTFSRPFKDVVSGRVDRTWAGMNCLIARNPARRSSDFQKVRLVRQPALDHIIDVAVFSTKGRQPQANKLQGGDYDGDTFWICIEPELVESFKNAPAPRYPPDPRDLFLEKDMTTFGDIVRIPSDSNAPFDVGEVKEWLARNRRKRMDMNMLGRLTLLQEKLAYYFGIASAPANVMNDLCDYIIDYLKQCITMTEEGFAAFCKKYKIDNNLPEPSHRKYTSFDDGDKIANGEKSVSEPLKRSIVDEVYFTILESEMVKARTLVKERTTQPAKIADPHLTSYYTNSIRDAQQGTLVYDELKQLNTRLSEIMEAAKAIQSQLKKSTAEGLACIQACRAKYDAIVPLNTVDAAIQGWTIPVGNDTITIWEFLKASALADKCRYTQDNVFRIPFRIAGDELCRLKAHALGPTRTLTFPAYLSMKPTHLYASASFRDSAGEEDGAEAGYEDEDGVEVKVQGEEHRTPLQHAGRTRDGSGGVDNPGPNASLRRRRNQLAEAGTASRAGDPIDLSRDDEAAGRKAKRRRSSTTPRDSPE